MITRRTFILGSAVVSGGIAVGYYHGTRPRPTTPRLPDTIPLRPGQVSITPYVVVDQDGITIIAPRAEMGQGIHTTLAALVAEELDVAFDAIRVAHGPASEHYSNRFMFGDPPFPGHVHRKPTQATIAQSSIRDAFVRMRKAGAGARLVLLQAAAERCNCSPDLLRTEAGAVVSPDGRRIGYESLAEHAATLDIPQDPPLKPRFDWRLLGRSLPRVDMIGKCMGSAEFGIDVRHPDLLYAAIKRNPGIDAPVVSMDTSAAESQPGVERIVPIRDGAIVIASNTWYAMQAAEKIRFVWGPADYPRKTEDHLAAIRKAFEDEPYFEAFDRGEVDKVHPGGIEISGEYSVPYLSHATMEPMNATAWYRDDRLDIWVGNQWPTLATLVGKVVSGLKEEQVHVHTTYMGGGFGRRFELYEVKEAVLAAMSVPGRPVRLTYSREEDLTHDAYRQMAGARFRAVVVDGKPVALDLKLSAASMYASYHKREHVLLGKPDDGTPSADTHITHGMPKQPYKIPHHRVTAYLARNPLPVGWWRSVGESQNAFFQESIIDEMANAAARDPLTMRLEMIDHGPSREVLRAVAELSGWGTPLPPGRARGLAYFRSSDAATAQVIEVQFDNDRLTLLKACAAIDVGVALDPRNIESQIQGSLVFGLSSAMFGQITIADGAVQERNFDSYRLLRMRHAPPIEVAILESGEEIFGVGECATATAAPALGNAIFAATGRRIRDLPFSRHIDFA